MHMCIAWMGFGTGHPSVNDASAFWAELRVVGSEAGLRTAQRGGRESAESVEVVMMGKEFDDRAFEMTAECNGYLGQLPTLSGLQLASGRSRHGWTDMK
jgi:hypothetical protein